MPLNDFLSGIYSLQLMALGIELNIPDVSLAFPPVGVHGILSQPGHTTGVCAWLNTTWIFMQSAHLTSMK